MEKVEFLILRNLLHNEEYLRKVVPFLKSEYFEDEKQKIVYQEISNFVEQYNELTTKEVLCIVLQNWISPDKQSFVSHLQNILILERERLYGDTLYCVGDF